MVFPFSKYIVERECYPCMSSEDCWFAVTAAGVRIGFDMCFSADCALHVSLCACEDGPTPPNLGMSVGALTVEPPAMTSAA
jgi:hypothetical protein